MANKAHMQHIYTTLVGWDQVDQHLLRKREEYINRFPSEYTYSSMPAPSSGSLNVSEENRFAKLSKICNALEERLSLPFHASLTPMAALNTLRYMYFHMRCGIYVMIRRGEVKMFVPFVNDEYRNTFAHRLNKFDVPHSSKLSSDPDSKMKAYYAHKWKKVLA